MIHYILNEVDTSSSDTKIRDLNLIEEQVNGFVQNSFVTVSLVQPMFQIDAGVLWVGAMIEYTMRRR